MLTRKQLDLLMFINERLKETGVPPSFDEMKEALDLASKSGIHRLITALEERGFIRRLPNRARALEVIRLPDSLTPGGQRRGFSPSVIEGSLGKPVPTPQPAPRASKDSDAGSMIPVPMMGKIAAGERPDECASRDDILNRYESLDRVFEETRRRGRLLSKAELPDFFRREHGGILIHIDRNGAPLRAASGGIHRLAIAQILELPEIPVQIGAVHRDAVKKGLYAPLRRSRIGTGA